MIYVDVSVKTLKTEPFDLVSFPTRIERVSRKREAGHQFMKGKTRATTIFYEWNE